MEKCIYCNNPDDLTDSHIIPECLGANLLLKDAVCHDCNSFLGRTIEAKICKDFRFYRFLAQIKTKKRKHPTTQADLEVLGKKVKISVGKGGLPKSIPPIIVEEGPPRQYFVVAESPKKLKKYMKKFEKIGVKFDSDEAIKQDVKLTFTADKRYISSDDYLRVVAKIAFERLCGTSPQRAFQSGYDKVKQFVRHGQYQNSKPAQLIYEENLVKKILALPFPYHSILLFAYGKLIASIVSIFGLFYYFILLNDNNRLLQEWADFIYFNPQTRESRVPILERDYSLERILTLIERSRRDPEVETKSQVFAREKFDEVVSKIRLKKNRVINN